MSGHAEKEWKKRIDEAMRDGKKELHLKSCGMGKEEGRMQYLYEFLKDNETVKVLDLSNNQVGVEGMRYLSEGLKANQTVKWLNLAFNQIGDEGMRYLSEELKVNQTVEALDLGDNQVGDEGMRYLSEGLQANKTVKGLYLRNIQFGDEGMHHLIEAAQVNTSLVYVDADDNAVSHDVERLFKNTLSDLPAREVAREEYLSRQASRMVKSAAKR